MCKALESIAISFKGANIDEASQSEALNLRLTEQYMESLDAILRKSTTLMIPGNGGSNGDMTSPQNIAQILTTYKHVMGGANQS